MFISHKGEPYSSQSLTKQEKRGLLFVSTPSLERIYTKLWKKLNF